MTKEKLQIFMDEVITLFDCGEEEAERGPDLLAVETAFSELDSVQLCDNTAAEADEARKEIKQIIRDLVKRLTIK